MSIKLYRDLLSPLKMYFLRQKSHHEMTFFVRESFPVYFDYKTEKLYSCQDQKSIHAILWMSNYYFYLQHWPNNSDRRKKALLQHNGTQFELQFFHFSESLTFHLKWKYDWHSGKIFVRFDIFFMFWTNIDECIFPHIIESGRIQLSVFANVVYTYLCSHSLPSIHTFFFH